MLPDFPDNCKCIRRLHVNPKGLILESYEPLMIVYSNFLAPAWNTNFKNWIYIIKKSSRHTHYAHFEPLLQLNSIY